HMLDYGIIQMDETGVQVLKEPDRPATSKSFMWIQRGGAPDRRIILFDYDPSRSGQVPLGLLTEYRGWLQTDGYSGYSAVGALPNSE
ncbi:MAG TPA: IS66 family transposase, partial [Alphaproteobacteria bacterium]|nr:IS66 family transposase [Alphaproteobacteria bacterium]